MLKKLLLWMSTVAIVFLGTLQLSDEASLRIYEESINVFAEFQLEDAEKMLNCSLYNSTLFNYIYTHGFNGNLDGNFSMKVISAVLKRKAQLRDRNVIGLDWRKEAGSIEILGNTGSYVFSGLSQSLKVASDFGNALWRMSNIGYKLNETHLVGHSLGAHVHGNAGRKLKEYGKSVRRISGYDPAGAFFDKYFPLIRALDKSCADYVVTTHTDPGGYGENSSNAHAAIWANYGNFLYGSKKDQVQPGCPIGDFDMFTENVLLHNQAATATWLRDTVHMTPGSISDSTLAKVYMQGLLKIDLCSHNRCLELLVQTLLGGKLEASKADNYSTWNENVKQRIVTEVVLLGDNTDSSARGFFFLNTTAFPPYQ